MMPLEIEIQCGNIALITVATVITLQIITLLIVYCYLQLVLKAAIKERQAAVVLTQQESISESCTDLEAKYDSVWPIVTTL